MSSSKSLIKCALQDWEKDKILWYLPLITNLQGEFQTICQHDIALIRANTNALD